MQNNNLNITSVKIFMPKENAGGNGNGDSKVKAFASFVLNDGFRVSGVKIIDGEKGLFASLPKRRDADGNFWQVVAPLTREVYQYIQDELVHQYTVAQATA